VLSASDIQILDSVPGESTDAVSGRERPFFLTSFILCLVYISYLLSKTSFRGVEV
jgi:hypothetical protein